MADDEVARKEARKQARRDRTQWMDALLQTGDWQQIRNVRRPRKPKCGRLQDSNGQLVESDAWGDTMADHLETVQWYVRPPGSVEGPRLGNELPVCLGQFSTAEVKKVVDKLRHHRACGPDGIPAEFFKHNMDEDCIRIVLDILNDCWNNEIMPNEMELAELAPRPG